MKIIVILFYFVLFTSTLVYAESSPRDTLDRFGESDLITCSLGLPDESQREELATLFSPSLLSLLREARTAEATVFNQTPAGEKPDSFEGNIYTGIFEGGNRIGSSSLTIDGVRAVGVLEMFHVYPMLIDGHPDLSPPSVLQVLLKQEQGKWLVYDIQFTGTNGTTLSKILHDYIVRYGNGAGSTQ